MAGYKLKYSPIIYLFFTSSLAASAKKNAKLPAKLFFSFPYKILHYFLKFKPTLADKTRSKVSIKVIVQDNDKLTMTR